jgi:type IX secretion system PorP/SprF family membrane protein
MKKGISFIILVISAAVELSAQQQPLLSQYMLNSYYLNPAYSGSGERLSFTFLHRAQWAGYENYQGDKASQQVQLFNVSINPDSTGHNAGFQFTRDKFGAVTSTGVQVSYAYRIPVTEKSTLALGFRGGITSKSINFGEYITEHSDDPFIADGKQSETKPDVSLGLWLEHEKYYVGVSAKGVVTPAEYETLGIQNEKLLTATGGYHFVLNKEWIFTPSAQVVTNTDMAFVESNVLIKNNNSFWAGLSYRHEEAATVLAGFGMLEQKLHFSYAFDYITSNKSIKSNTSHEIMVRYCIGRLHARKKKNANDA